MGSDTIYVVAREFYLNGRGYQPGTQVRGDDPAVSSDLGLQCLVPILLESAAVVVPDAPVVADVPVVPDVIVPDVAAPIDPEDTRPSVKKFVPKK